MRGSDPVTVTVSSLPGWDWRDMTEANVEWLVALKARAMRPDLERLGVWHPARSRRRLLDELALDETRIVVLNGEAVGSIALVPAPQTSWLQHFYIEPALQGRGLGGAVLRRLLETNEREVPVRLLALRGSRAIRLYQRHGFRTERSHDNGLDEVLVRGTVAARSKSPCA